MHSIPWRVGFEIELLLPPGKSREDLALALAKHHDARLRRCFHLESEPSAVPGMAVFHNLTLGFVVEDVKGEWLLKCLDDLTLQADLQKSAAPRPGWYRIVSDDTRILRLIEQQTDASREMSDVLQPIAALFGTQPVSGPQGMLKVCDIAGGSVAMVCSLPGERERPCELITAPADRDQESSLEQLLCIARDLNCLVPVEGATHVHFDGSALRSAGAVANLVNLLNSYGPLLRWIWQTNPRCTRLGAWPAQLSDLVNTPEFSKQTWDQARAQLARLDLTKYCDFNIINLLRSDSFCTVELRILPSLLEAEPIAAAARLFALILKRAVDSSPVLASPAREPGKEALHALFEVLSLEPAEADYWLHTGRSAPPVDLSSH